MSYPGEKGNDDITRAETPNAIFRRLLQHIDGIGASLKKVFPRVSAAVQTGQPDRFVIRAIAKQLGELASAAEDLENAIETQWLTDEKKPNGG